MQWPAKFKVHGSAHFVWFPSGQDFVSRAWSDEAGPLVFSSEHYTTISGIGGYQTLAGIYQVLDPGNKGAASMGRRITFCVSVQR